MCGTAMFALYCWASIDLLRERKRLSPPHFSSIHVRHRLLLCFFKGGEMVTGAASVGSASSLWSPWVKEKQVCLLPSFYRCCGAAVCYRQTNRFFYLVFSPHEARVSSTAIHAHNTVTPRHNATKPSHFVSHCDALNAAAASPIRTHLAA